MATFTVTKYEAGEQVGYTLSSYESVEELSRNLEWILDHYGEVAISKRD